MTYRRPLPPRGPAPAVVFTAITLGLASAAPAAAAGPLELVTRSRTPLEGGGELVVQQVVRWAPEKTALVICDMWDQHWCQGATRRVSEMAPLLNAVAKRARKQGVSIIHAPSSTLNFYSGWAQLEGPRNAPRAETRTPLKSWVNLDPKKEGKLPIDDSDGGCDCRPQCKGGSPWKRQIAKIEIHPEDAITDSADAYHYLRHKGIENLIVTGVHTNMCVLGRPFSIRQMVNQGINVVLVRDLTDSMYNPRKAPFVSHFRGTELVVEHIERHWAPTTTSASLLGGVPRSFRYDHRPHLVILMAEKEYRTALTLPAFAERHLAVDFRLSYVTADPADPNRLLGSESIGDADVLLVSVRRRALPPEQLNLVRQHVAAGKPVVGIRTASHAFALRKGVAPPGGELWPDFDPQVLGGNYTGHHGNKESTTVQVDPGAPSNHPVLRGVTREPIAVGGSLYKVLPLADGAEVLLTGKVKGQPPQPVAWTFKHSGGGLTFYTSLGHPVTFDLTAFRQLLANAIFWAAGKEVPEGGVPLAPAGNASAGPAPPAGGERGAGENENQPNDTTAPAAAWVRLDVPGTWDGQLGGRFDQLDGHAWYRSAAEIPAGWAGRPLTFFLSSFDNACEVFFNGVRIGGAGSLPPGYRNGLGEAVALPVPAALVRAGAGVGPNTVALRAWDNEGRGGFKGAAPSLGDGRGNQIVLAGEWDFRPGDDLAWATPGDGEAADLPVFREVTRTPAVEAETAKPDRPAAAKPGRLGPQESFARLVVADDLEADLLLHEPLVAQPLFLNFDERGRLWVVQYRQYPDPAGLKRLSRDAVWRIAYDRAPPPPPHSPGSPFYGKDRITVHEDTDGDGVYDRHKTFLEGLNCATSLARGRGGDGRLGVWVLNPPYLLFFPDEDGDDIPDGPPAVHLKGFWLEDTHSIANSLRWGPDGWLYGTQGSTVSATIVRPGIDAEEDALRSMGQNVWRYHPEGRRFDIFAEGGGNAFGLEIDAKGRIYSGHNGGDTRGFHYVQGGYYRKGWNKHGELTNPYAFGYFPMMKHHRVARFTHQFLIYEGGGLPARYDGTLWGVDVLHSNLVYSEIKPLGSTFETRDLGRPLDSEDKWFRPVHVEAGPSGALYVADWYDEQVNHYRNHEGRIDPSSGRIYRLRAKGAPPPPPPPDLGRLGTAALVEKLGHPNRWVRQTALRLIGDRREAHASLVPVLARRLRGDGQDALEALWALNLCGGFDEATAVDTMDHRDPYVRLWAVRLLGDDREAGPGAARRLARMAREEAHPEVLSQLACTAKRLPPAGGLPVAAALMARDELAADPHLPLLVWWAVEAAAGDGRAAVVERFLPPEVWGSKIARETVLPRLVKRFALAGKRADFLACAQLFKNAPDPGARAALLAAFEEAFSGRSLPPLPEALALQLARAGGEDGGSLVLGLRRGEPVAVERALARLGDAGSGERERLVLLKVLAEVDQPRAAPVLLQLVGDAQAPEGLRRAALAALARQGDPGVAARVLALYPDLPEALREPALDLLASRATWARQLLRAAAEERIEATAVPAAVVQKFRLHPGDEIARLAGRLWGESTATAAPVGEAASREIARIKAVLAAAPGTPKKGEPLFQQRCLACHKIFSLGGSIGPDLTSYQRDDTDALLLAIVDPGAEIREGFEQIVLTTKDNAVHTGFLADQDAGVLVLRDLAGRDRAIPGENIARRQTLPLSLMPPGLLNSLSDQQLRDLFAYLRSTTPPF